MIQKFLTNKLAGTGTLLAIGGAILLGAMVFSGKNTEPTANGLDGVKKKSTHQRKNKSATVNI